MAWEIVVAGLGSVAITGAITLKGVSMSGKIAAAKAKDDHDREVKRDTLRRRLELRHENLKPLREVIVHLTVIMDRYGIGSTRAGWGDPTGNIEARAAAEELKSLRETTGPQPWWTVPDETLAKLCESLFSNIGNLELALVMPSAGGQSPNVYEENLAVLRVAIAKRMEELISGSDLSETPPKS